MSTHSETSPAPLTVRGNEAILVVEDAEPLRKLATLFLKDNGYQVLTAADGSEALQVASRHAGAIHMLLTDVVMPGMNGRALAEKLALRYPVMKVLYMSGYTDSFIAGHGVLEQGVQLLHKPFTEEALIRKVREVLDTGTDAQRMDPADKTEISALTGPGTSLSR